MTNPGRLRASLGCLPGGGPERHQHLAGVSDSPPSQQRQPQRPGPLTFKSTFFLSERKPTGGH